jgi:hypothetical protein
MSQNITMLSLSMGSDNEVENSKTRCFYNYNFEFRIMQVVVLNLIAKHI